MKLERARLKYPFYWGVWWGGDGLWKGVKRGWPAAGPWTDKSMARNVAEQGPIRAQSGRDQGVIRAQSRLGGMLGLRRSGRQAGGGMLDESGAAEGFGLEVGQDVGIGLEDAVEGELVLPTEGLAVEAAAELVGEGAELGVGVGAAGLEPGAGAAAEVGEGFGGDDGVAADGVVLQVGEEDGEDQGDGGLIGDAGEGGGGDEALAGVAGAEQVSEVGGEAVVEGGEVGGGGGDAGPALQLPGVDDFRGVEALGFKEDVDEAG